MKYNLFSKTEKLPRFQNRETLFECDKYNEHYLDNAWVTNREFAYWLIGFLKPDMLVELGTHYGCSLFAFMQAIKNQKLSTKVYALDTWVGDFQAGYYKNDVFSLVKEIKENSFQAYDLRLVKKYFHDAINDFDNKSIDILHIDGLHTYEAVKSDFENWLPKMKESGVILLHDVGQLAKEKGYGSHSFWQEIKRKYYTLEFTHYWGLGVVLLNPMQNGKLKSLVNNAELISSYFTFFQEYIQQQKEIVTKNKLIREREEIMNKQESMISDRDEAIIAQTKLIDERDGYIKELLNKFNQ